MVHFFCCCKFKWTLFYYHNDPRLSDRQVWANSVDLDGNSVDLDQALHCLPFHLHRLDTSLYFKRNSLRFWIIITCLNFFFFDFLR